MYENKVECEHMKLRYMLDGVKSNAKFTASDKFKALVYIID